MSIQPLSPYIQSFSLWKWLENIGNRWISIVRWQNTSLREWQPSITPKYWLLKFNKGWQDRSSKMGRIIKIENLKAIPIAISRGVRFFLCGPSINNVTPGYVRGRGYKKWLFGMILNTYYHHSRLRQSLIKFQAPETKPTQGWSVCQNDSKNVLHEILTTTALEGRAS